MTATRLHIVVAGLFGAAGVALLAAGAHAGSPLPGTAGQMLLFHAPVLIAATLARKAGAIDPAIGRVALALMAVGAALFAAQLSVRGFTGAAGLSYAAPLGGVLIIAGWLGLALAALRRPEA